MLLLSGCAFVADGANPQAPAQQLLPAKNISQEPSSGANAILFLNNSTAASSFADVTYFYSPACHFCEKVSPLVARMQSRFNNSISWQRVDVNTVEGFAAFESMLLRLNLSNASRVVPFVVVGNHALIGEPDINCSLEGLLYDYSGGSG